MTPSEIKIAIDKNNRRIEELFVPSTFVLNDDIKKLIDENNRLRKLCAHEFDSNGICIYCYSQEDY